MKIRAAIIIVTLLATSSASALRVMPRPTTTLTRALACDGAAPELVLNAIETLGKPDTNAGDYILEKPLILFGLPVTHVTVTDSAGESGPTYIAKFPDVDINEVVAAARLTLRAGGYMRDTDDGRLSIDIFDRVVVGLSCTPRMRRADSPIHMMTGWLQSR
ncbi:hypothetical protein [Pseudoduganella buxea]|uniref:Uncharacterized protein n=1 Tax=Pseudoduganella buxea TaxID=1949069 RepID=A0A6I3T0P0_9BURK|nr:hypothetical protein [Pseudoduganella buxea]MTV55151.1 hypothetical protein [Pseudoduganella buxea]GGB84248.1 hypothetical protein GCM10011572_02720 [Pseudoduganella buxea]